MNFCTHKGWRSPTMQALLAAGLASFVRRGRPYDDVQRWIRAAAFSPDAVLSCTPNGTANDLRLHSHWHKPRGPDRAISPGVNRRV